MEIIQFLTNLVAQVIQITAASVVSYYVMRRIIRQDVRQMILDRIFNGKEIKELEKLITRINDALDSKDMEEVKKHLMRILGEL